MLNLGVDDRAQVYGAFLVFLDLTEGERRSVMYASPLWTISLYVKSFPQTALKVQGQQTWCEVVRDRDVYLRCVKNGS